MDWKLFASTFALVFLAELGDKTQLTALAAASGAKSPWSVFAGASIALVLSTLIAVLVGEGLTRVFPERYLKLVSGILFLVFGAILVIQNIKPAPEVRESNQIEIRPGFASRFVLNRAREFEEASLSGYLKAAAAAASPELKSILLAIAEEEKTHFERLADPSAEGERFTEEAAQVGSPVNIGSAGQADDKALTLSAVEHERSTEAFYSKLGSIVHVASLKPLFAELAAGESRHRELLEKFAKEKGWIS